jgi:hypothetical protein
MCTLTWRRKSPTSYEVFFNRDEKKTRSRAEPPGLHEADGLRFLAPRDPDGGGTWMLANQLGLAVCLLNRWQEEDPAPSLRAGSRGRLVWAMAGCENVPAVEERLRTVNLSGNQPFVMVAFDPVGERGWAWNGHELAPMRLEMPVCSSSFHYEEVAAARRSRFRDLQLGYNLDGGLLECFHRDTLGGPSAFTVRMCRSDAQTVSRSHLRVGRRGIRWLYWDEQPELRGEPTLEEAELTFCGPAPMMWGLGRRLECPPRNIT